MRKGNPDPLPLHLQEEWERLEAKLDGPVDLTDIPEIIDGPRGVRGHFAQPRKEQVSVSLDVDLIAFVEQAEHGSLEMRLNTLLRDWVAQAKQAAE